MSDKIPDFYLKALENRLSKVSLPIRGTRRREVDFRDFYFKLQTDQGKFAFQSHAHQMERAKNIRQDASVLSEDSDAFSVANDTYDTHDELNPVTDEPQDIDPLEEELFFPHESLVLDTEGLSLDALSETGERFFSRIIAIANAGHGKTTLTNRIALFYCQPNSQDKNDEELCRAYQLPRLPLIPCIIKLRDYSKELSLLSADKSDSSQTLEEKDKALRIFVDSAIQKSISGEIHSFCRVMHKDEQDIPCYIPDDQDKQRLLLLIDGLDELSCAGRKSFLLALKDYLSRYAETHVIMSSRVAGLEDEDVKPLLRSMHFRGRSIMPLTDSDAEMYAKSWISKTAESASVQSMMANLDSIMSQNRFRYMRELMRAPLDLTIMLQSLSNGTIALNRFEMFSSILRTRFTNHVNDNAEKQAVYTDTMLILGLAAYRMQKNNVLYISQAEITEMVPVFNKYRYQSSIPGDRTPKAYIDFFDDLSVNSGIIEKELLEDGARYIIAIRSYQEFLTAYAVCSLRFSAEMPRPNPAGILIKHCGDTSWNGIINFALAKLSGDSGSTDALNRLLNYIFTQCTDTELLRSVIESDSKVSDASARLLFETRFQNTRLLPVQRSLLSSCMNAESYFSYECALISLFNTGNGSSYLEAYSHSIVLAELRCGKRVLETVMQHLKANGSSRHSQAGAVMLCELAKLALERETHSLLYSDDTPVSDDTGIRSWQVKNSGALKFSDMAARILVADENIARLLYSKAIEYKDLRYIEALTNLFLVNPEWTELIKQCLTKELLEIVISKAEEFLPKLVPLLCVQGNVSDLFNEFRELVYALGIIGSELPDYDVQHMFSKPQNYQIMQAAISAFYRFTLTDTNSDKLSAAYAKRLVGGSYGQFIEDLFKNICCCMVINKGQTPEESEVRTVKISDCCARERRFFDAVKNSDEMRKAALHSDGHSLFLNTNPEIDAGAEIFRILTRIAFNRIRSFMPFPEGQ